MMYNEFGLSLTDGQKNKIAVGVKNKKSVTIRLLPNQYNGPDKLMLTKGQIDKITKHKTISKGVTIKLSMAQLQHQTGGWLGSLLAGLASALLPGLFSTGKGRKSKGKGIFLPGTIPVRQ